MNIHSMTRIISVFIMAFLLIPPVKAQKVKISKVDICIYGGTSAGVIAAYTAKKMGKTVILIEPGRHLGGMSSGGLGFTDIGNKYVVTGLARDFYRRVGKQYGKFEQWIFEPKVAEAIFKDYIKRAGVTVLYENRVIGVKRAGNVIREISLENSYEPSSFTNQSIKAKVFIDCSYEGDLMANAGISYTVGREANSLYNETFNGVQLLKGHQFPDGIDPYIVPGDSASGLLWGISKEPVKPNGTGDRKVQAYCFRTTLTNVPENRIPITKPDNYDPLKYELWLRLMSKGNWKSMYSGFIWSMMPNRKTDINNYGGFSMDMIGMNWDYPDASYDKRKKIWKEHEDYTKGLFYFVGHDSRVSDTFRKEMLEWGYPKDEYTDNGNWTHQLYIREARRMIGELVMTQHHCQGKELVNDGIGMAAYTMDSHNCDREVVKEMVKNEGNIEAGGFGPYPISYRAIIPKQSESVNLLVPVCLSATHIAYGSIRMEPVFMVLGQSSAVAACLAIDKGLALQNVNVKDIQAILKNNPLADNGKPEVLVDNDDTDHIILNGNWKKEMYGGYGPTFLTDDSKGKILKYVRFVPTIRSKGKYQIYIYCPKLKNEATQTAITVFDGKKYSEEVLQKVGIKVEGQTSGEWVSIGSYNLNPGEKSYVEISNKNADNIIVADAVLFVPVE
jgi:hypothetical protein